MAFIGENAQVHYASLIPPLPSEYTGPGPYTSMYPAPEVPKIHKMQMTPEQAYPHMYTVPAAPQQVVTSYNPFEAAPVPAPAAMPAVPQQAFVSYNPFEGGSMYGLGFFENPTWAFGPPPSSAAVSAKTPTTAVARTVTKTPAVATTESFVSRYKWPIVGGAGIVVLYLLLRKK